MRIAIVAFFILFVILMAPFSFSQEIIEYDEYDSRNRRDPAIPLVDKDGNLLPEVRPLSSVEEISLEGILWSEGGESFAIISGAVLRVGDLFGDYKVIKIERQKVVLTRAGEEVTVNLSAEEE